MAKYGGVYPSVFEGAPFCRGIFLGQRPWSSRVVNTQVSGGGAGEETFVSGAFRRIPVCRGIALAVRRTTRCDGVKVGGVSTVLHAPGYPFILFINTGGLIGHGRFRRFVDRALIVWSGVWRVCGVGGCHLEGEALCSVL